MSYLIFRRKRGAGRIADRLRHPRLQVVAGTAPVVVLPGGRGSDVEGLRELGQDDEQRLRLLALHEVLLARGCELMLGLRASGEHGVVRPAAVAGLAPEPPEPPELEL